VNVFLRVLIVAFAVEAVVAKPDPRFAGKGIAVRDLILAGAALTLVIPALHVIRGRGKPYPLRSDCLLLSVMALDMAGNSFGLYEQPWRFDLVAHGYGPGAVMLALGLAGIGWTASMLAVNGGHVLLEIQEAATDALFATHNVHGAGHDLRPGGWPRHDGGHLVPRGAAVLPREIPPRGVHSTARRSAPASTDATGRSSFWLMPDGPVAAGLLRRLMRTAQLPDPQEVIIMEAIQDFIEVRSRAWEMDATHRHPAALT
jgi:hypothetical protein